jgi:DNA (cytosine-5)-methyltransferase 1
MKKRSNGAGSGSAANQSRANGRGELTAGALFSGIGGFCLGFQSMGFRTAWANDTDPYACAVYRRNFPNTRLIEKDVRKLSVVKDRLEPVDVLHAGFPCQSFSQAGSRTGFEDQRGRLFFEVIRIVNEFKRRKPAVVVLENAPYLKWGAGGAWYGEIMRQLQQAGYWFRESNGQELDLFALTDIPQARSRLFMVAWSIDHFQSGRFAFPYREAPPQEGRRQIHQF